ncbi:MAG: ABC transporter ATP-binding protein [Hyphomicrobiaceae bacterium]|nr:ABC transporter ATP-binding protein [Hyphomicrobiaceae bacterium]
MASVEFSNVTKLYGGDAAVNNLNLSVREGEFLTLLGPSGCGKTTTLRMLAGFITPTGGRILVDGIDITRVPPEKRNLGMVFQNYVLFPHLNIGDNIAFGLRERRVPKDVRRRRVAELLDLVRLPGVEDRYPGQLSGGQQQRVALARALAIEPRILLMDEPLGALDLKLREAMQYEIKRIQSELGITTIYVTHDQQEALHMSDRVVVMCKGRIEQVEAPKAIYERPATRFVGDFVGTMNFIDGEVQGSEKGALIIRTGSGRLITPKPSGQDLNGGHPVHVAVRPESLVLAREKTSDPKQNELPCRVDKIRYSGAHNEVFVILPSDECFIVEVKDDSDCSWQSGEEAVIRWDFEKTLIWRQ